MVPVFDDFVVFPVLFKMVPGMHILHTLAVPGMAYGLIFDLYGESVFEVAKFL